MIAAVFMGAVTTVETAHAQGPFSDAFDARDQLVEDRTRACGQARVRTAESTEEYRRAEFEYAHATDADDRLDAQRDMLRINGDWRVEMQEIIADLQDDIAEQSRVFSQRRIAEMQAQVPSYIAQCARSGQ